MIDLLAIAPHPDDIELAAGGTVAILAAAGRRVVMLDLTQGERATRGTPELRREEADRAARILGAEAREGLALPDGGLVASDPTQLRAVVAAIRRHRPRLIITMHRNDDHPDHIEGDALVERAAYLAGLRNYPDPDQEPHRAERMLFAMGRRSFDPTLIVDVTPVYAKKREALEAFASQFHRDPGDSRATPISDPGFLERVEARDRLHGGRIGVAYGEPLLTREPLAIRGAANLLPEAGR
jgi:bacillithiol biosynthesis deacetylase BshB1